MSRYIPDTRVSQEQYGCGTVLESDDHHTVIDFDEHGVRRFVTSMVVLMSTTTVAPKKAKRAKSRRKAKSKA